MKKVHKILITGIIAILVILAIGFLYKTPTNEDKETRVLNIADNDKQVIQFKQLNPDAESKVSVLKSNQIKESAEKYPAIYGELPEKTLYEVNYNSFDTGLKLIVDLEEKSVLKIFETSTEVI